MISFTLISHSSCARAPVAYSTLRSVISRCPVIVVGFGQESMIFTSSCEKYLIQLTDVLTKEQRRKNMQHIRSKDTKIEVLLRKALWHKGIRYRKNYSKIPGKPNIEDYLRVMNELLPALEILDQKDAYIELKNEIETCLSSFTSNISEIEYSIASADYDKRTEAFNRLVSFLMSFASRTGTRDRLNIFTTNYDRMIEAGADLAGLRLVDRFVGSLSPVFRSSRMDIDMHYNPPGIRGEPRYLEGVVKYTKLHGSMLCEIRRIRRGIF